VGCGEHLSVKGDEMECSDHGDGAIKHKKMTRIGSAEAEGNDGLVSPGRF
jgi:hypothetical protein